MWNYCLGYTRCSVIFFAASCRPWWSRGAAWRTGRGGRRRWARSWASSRSSCTCRCRGTRWTATRGNPPGTTPGTAAPAPCPPRPRQCAANRSVYQHQSASKPRCHNYSGVGSCAATKMTATELGKSALPAESSTARPKATVDILVLLQQEISRSWTVLIWAWEVFFFFACCRAQGWSSNPRSQNHVDFPQTGLFQGKSRDGPFSA